VLLIFGIFLTERTEASGPIQNVFRRPVSALIIAGATLFLVVSTVRTYSVPPPELAKDPTADPGAFIHGWDRTHGSLFIANDPENHKPQTAVAIAQGRNPTLIIGQAFLTDYIVAFELASIVLLIGLIGAASIARKEVRT